MLPELFLKNPNDLPNNHVCGVTILLVLLVARLKIWVLLPGVAVWSGVVRSAESGV